MLEILAFKTILLSIVQNSVSFELLCFTKSNSAFASNSPSEVEQFTQGIEFVAGGPESREGPTFTS